MDWTPLLEVAAHLTRSVPNLAAAVLVLIAGRFLIRFSTPFRAKRDLVDEANPAAGVLFGGYLLSVGLTMAGTLFGRGQDAVLLAVAKILGEGILAIILLRVSIWVNDRFILHRFSVVKEIREDKNLGVGFCVAGSCLAGGLVLNGALVGFSQDYLHGLRDIVIFWLLGQLVLVLGAYVHQKLTRYDVHALIEYDDNVAAGISFGAFLVSLGLVVRAAVVGAGLDVLGRELARSFLIGIVGVLCVIAVSALAPRIVAARVDYEDEVEMRGNSAVSAVAACASLAVAILIAAAIQR